MEKWNTQLLLKINVGLMQSGSIKINIEVFWCDSSPLLLCTVLIPLTHELNRFKCGYQVYGTERKVGHLLYTDDLKLIGRSEEGFRNKIRIVKTISNNIKIEFGLQKCPRVSLKSGKVHRKEHKGNTMENEIKESESKKAY